MHIKYDVYEFLKACTSCAEQKGAIVHNDLKKMQHPHLRIISEVRWANI